MREQVFLTEAEVRALLPELKTLGISEGVIFSSPGRTELYAYSEQVSVLPDSLIFFLLKQKDLKEKIPTKNFFSLQGKDVIEHLYSLAAGIDSMIVGDNQVLVPIQRGFELARETGVAGPTISKLFDAAVKCSGKARSRTKISEGAISVSHAAVELAEHIFDELKRKTVLIIGSGETVQQAAQHLMERGIGTVYTTHSVAEKAANMAKSLGGTAFPFDGFRERLPSVDIVLSSLQSAPFILSKEDIKRVRPRGTILLVDLGMPRNIDPFATELEQVFVYDLDTLNILVGENIARRRAEVPRVQSIITDELARLRRSGKPWSLFQEP